MMRYNQELQYIETANRDQIIIENEYMLYVLSFTIPYSKIIVIKNNRTKIIKKGHLIINIKYLIAII